MIRIRRSFRWTVCDKKILKILKKALTLRIGSGFSLIIFRRTLFNSSLSAVVKFLRLSSFGDIHTGNTSWCLFVPKASRKSAYEISSVNFKPTLYMKKGKENKILNPLNSNDHYSGHNMTSWSPLTAVFPDTGKL